MFQINEHSRSAPVRKDYSERCRRRGPEAVVRVVPRRGPLPSRDRLEGVYCSQETAHGSGQIHSFIHIHIRSAVSRSPSDHSVGKAMECGAGEGARAPHGRA